MIELNTIYCMDIFELCAQVDDASVDMILADLPYGTTACSWDTIIPLEPMWEAFKRIIKPRGAIVLTASQPFTSHLISSNYEMFRHEWIWEKTLATGYLNASIAPLKAHENILVFSLSRALYLPQMESGKPYVATSGNVGGYVKDKTVGGYNTINSGFRFPRSVLRFNSETNPIHPTQKPVALFEYLIRTYTQENELVFDPTCGSGTTAIAARNTNRHFICGDFTPEYVDLAKQRLQSTDPYLSTELKNGLTQMSLFENLGDI